MRAVELTIDVTGKVPIPGQHHLSAWGFFPVHSDGPTPLLLCLPGGSYTKAYWHLEVEGYPGYSFAEHMAARGLAVIALDHIGVGDSSRHGSASQLTPDVVAAINSVALAEVVARLRDGNASESLGPLEVGPIIGVGHSMGAMLAIVQQSLARDFDAIAPLGFGVVGAWAALHGLGAVTYEEVMGPARAGAFDEPFLPPRDFPDMRRHFYWDDVPAEVIAADDLTLTTLPGVTGPLSIVPYIAADHAGRITCPVFLGFGERDSTVDARREPEAYTSATDITVFVLRSSGHCHNTASTRVVLWDRLAQWISGIPPRAASQ